MREFHRVLTLSPAELLVLIVLLVTVVVLVAFRAAERLRPVGPDATLTADQDFSYQLDLNTASEHQLMLVPGIGSARAKKIIEYRQKHGRFVVVDELNRIEGFSGALVSRLRGYFCVHPPQLRNSE